MKLFHLLLSILGLGILTACKKSGYQTKDGSVYYNDYLMRTADYKSFQELNDVYASDKSRGYYRGITLDGSNGASFIALDDHYAKDKSTVFYCDNYLDFKLFETSRKDKISRIAMADAGSFSVLPNEYARDNFRAYYQGNGFEVMDVASFEPLDYGYGKDKHTGYFNLKPITTSSGDSFSVLTRNFSKDKQHVYYAWTKLDEAYPPGIRILKGALPDSFTAVGLYYATDIASVFYKDRPLKSADPGTFKQWSESIINYAFDTTHIYFQDKLILEADKRSFKLISDNYAVDEKAVYFEDHVLKNGDVASFSVLQAGYAKDNKRVYYEGKVLNGADPLSFTLVSNEADRDAADRKQSYHAGHRAKLEK